MKKYDPDESITCPKCGKVYNAEVMAPQFSHVKFLEGEVLVLISLCSFEFYRRPLDYSGPETLKKVHNLGEGKNALS